MKPPLHFVVVVFETYAVVAGVSYFHCAHIDCVDAVVVADATSVVESLVVKDFVA